MHDVLFTWTAWTYIKFSFKINCHFELKFQNIVDSLILTFYLPFFTNFAIYFCVESVILYKTVYVYIYFDTVLKIYYRN